MSDEQVEDLEPRPARYVRTVRLPPEVAPMIRRDARHLKELEPERRYSENDVLVRIIVRHYEQERAS